MASVLDFYSAHLTEPCVVLGNGPSLSQSLDKVRALRDEGYTILGSNRVYISGLTPDYLAVVDWLVEEDCHREIRNVEATNIFLDQRARERYPKDDKYVWLDFDKSWEEKHEALPHFWRYGSGTIYGGGTVTYVLLQLAYLMGFRTTILFGVDHRYVIPEGAIHQNGGIFLSQGPDPNHFDPGYFGPGHRFHDPMTERMEIAYQVAERVFSAAGRTIVNATPGTELRVFPALVQPVEQAVAA